jgi:methionine-rich copper-binding protein CopC
MVRVIVLGLAMLALASPASAHARLESASPPAGGQVSASPPELFITFTEGVEPLFSTIEVRNTKGAEVSTGSPYIVSGDKRRLAIKLPRLLPGTYTVIWHVTSVDTHKTKGSFKFTVKQ